MNYRVFSNFDQDMLKRIRFIEVGIGLLLLIHLIAIVIAFWVG